MRLKSVWNLFSKSKPKPDWPSMHSEHSRYHRQPDDLEMSRISHDPQTLRGAESPLEKLTAHLPHTLITSDLGTWDQTFRLRFNHLLPEDPSIAVFSETQQAPTPSAWRNKDHGFLGLGFRCRWYEGSLEARSPCTVRVIVDSRLQYKMPSKVIRHWNAEAGLLLVDWAELYNSYFAQERKTVKKTRATDDLTGYHRLEEETMPLEHGLSSKRQYTSVKT